MPQCLKRKYVSNFWPRIIYRVGRLTSVLIELRVVASRHPLCYIIVDPEACLVPEARIVAGLVVIVAKFKIIILSARLPLHLVLVNRKRCGGVKVALETYQVAERSEGVVENNIHTTGVNFINRGTPEIERAKVRLKY